MILRASQKLLERSRLGGRQASRAGPEFGTIAFAFSIGSRSLAIFFRSFFVFVRLVCFVDHDT